MQKWGWQTSSKNRKNTPIKKPLLGVVAHIIILAFKDGDWKITNSRPTWTLSQKKKEKDEGEEEEEKEGEEEDE